MSLINDALKRAKEANQQTPLPQADLPLRPVEPGQQRGLRGLGLLQPAGLAVAALLVLFLVWQLAHTRQATGPIEAAARTAPAPQITPTPPPALVSADAGAAAPAVGTRPGWPVQPASAPAPVSAPTGALAADPTVEWTNALVADTQERDATIATPVAAPAPPKPAPLRLQGILFNPRRPSAMISGKTVFVGDKVGGFRVAAIDQDSVTLAGAGQTKVLSLSE
jgi:hypothetical protein